MSRRSENLRMGEDTRKKESGTYLVVTDRRKLRVDIRPGTMQPYQQMIENVREQLEDGEVVQTVWLNVRVHPRAFTR